MLVVCLAAICAVAVAGEVQQLCTGAVGVCGCVQLSDRACMVLAHVFFCVLLGFEQGAWQHYSVATCAGAPVL